MIQYHTSEELSLYVFSMGDTRYLHLPWYKRQSGRTTAIIGCADYNDVIITYNRSMADHCRRLGAKASVMSSSSDMIRGTKFEYETAFIDSNSLLSYVQQDKLMLNLYASRVKR